MSTTARSKIKAAVLIHGWGGSAKSLALLASSLDLPHLLVELPGFGETELPGIYDLERYSDYVQGEINAYLMKNKLKPYEILLIGHSVGGKILLNLLGRDSTPTMDINSALNKDSDLDNTAGLRESQLVIINASGIRAPITLKKRLLKGLTAMYTPIKVVLYKIGLGGLQEFLQKAFYKFVVGARDYEKLNRTPLLKETFKLVIEQDISEAQMRRITNPTLLLWGELDKSTPVWMGRIFDKHIPDSQMVVVPGATHGLPLKQPERCAELIMAWVATHTTIRH